MQPYPYFGPLLLFMLKGADLTSTSDQQFIPIWGASRYIVSEIYAVCRSGGAATACDGGVYDAASKGGNAIIGSGQSWLGLSAANKIKQGTLASVAGTDSFDDTPYLSLTTGSSSAATADFYIYGYSLDI